MAQEDRQKARRIFMEVADLPESDRAAALERTCGGDSKLRAEVEALLRADAEAGSFMARPTGDEAGGSMLSMHFEAASARAPSEHAGKQIGPYKLLELIGEGGFGTVWMAEQREPVKRRVAIKLIKLGMDTKQVIARFEAERQALAMMDHPNIAKVLDAGSTEAGRPYFVMEYIRGIPILEYCDQEILDTKARLELFTQVCHAIQHAHHKGIIHRDIKPTNVLVTMHDGVPVPKVIDFGIAKATNSELTTRTLFTQHRQLIGTPAYMSPEQAEMSALDIDTRSDIYSLGVLLYEMLTGTTPFDVYDLRAKGYEEMLRIIREDEPHKPSTRVSTLGEDGAHAAKQRRAHDPNRLSVLLRGDLDWIVMKCLEKDRTRRYETANGLAADVQRHLRMEPVAAGAPSAAYKLRKFVRRNRGKVAAASLVAGTLILGVIATSGAMLWANDERDRAAEEKQKADVAAASESVAKVAAQQSAEKARAAARRAKAAKEEEAAARKRAEAISEFMVTALRSSDANSGGSQDMTILAAMDPAIADIESGRFKDDPAAEAELMGAIGHILANNGRWREAERLLRQALESERRLTNGDCIGLSRLMNNLALVLQDLGRKDEARLLFVKTLEMNQRLFPGDHEAVAKSLQNLGGAMSPEESVALRRQSLEMRRRLFRGDSDAVAHSLMNLAHGLMELGRTGEAEPLFAEAVEMGRRVFQGDHPFRAIAMDNLGKARVQLDRPAEGVDLLTQALAMRRRLYKHPHPDLAMGLHNLAAALKEQGRLAEAEPLYAEALEIWETCFKGDLWEFATTLNNLGALKLGQGRLAEAEPLLVRALEMRRRLSAGDHPVVADSLSRLAQLRLDQKRPAEADSLHAQSLEMMRRLHPGDHPDVALRLQITAVSLRDRGRPAEAEPFQMQAVEMYQRLFPGDSRQVSLALYTLGDVRDEAGRVAEAVAPIEAALEMDRRLLPANHKDLLADLEKLARVYNLNRRYEKATPLYEEASKGYEATLGRQDPLTLHMIGNLGANYEAVGRAAEAVPLLEEAWKNAKKYPKLGQFGPFLLDAYVAVADPAKEGSVARALALLDELLASSRATLAKESPELAQELANKSQRLMNLKAWDRAEPLLREVLAIREKVQPDGWRTFNTKSMLGEAILVQKRYAEAEPLLLAGYRGMKERETTIEGGGRVRITQALERLVRLYEAQGNASEASVWRAKLEEARAAESRPTARESQPSTRETKR